LREVHKKRSGHGEVGRNVLVENAEAKKECERKRNKKLGSDSGAHWFVVKHEPGERNDKNNPRAVGNDLLR
jgi:hypothetical protein